MKELLNKYILLLLLGTTLCVLSGNEFFHHHENTKDEANCKVCLFSHNLKSTAAGLTVINISPFQYETSILNADELISSVFYIEQFSSRAPPALS